MNFYARIAGIDTDLTRLPNDAARREVLASIRLDRRFLLRSVLVNVVLFPLVFIGGFAVTQLTNIAWVLPVAYFTMVFSAWPLTGLVNAAINRRLLQRILRERLREYSIRLCLHCGYNLQGTAGDQCPECGQFDEPILFSDGESAPYGPWEHLRLSISGLRSQLDGVGDVGAQRRFWREVCRRIRGREALLICFVFPVAGVFALLGAIFVSILASLIRAPDSFLLVAYFVGVGCALICLVLWSCRALLRSEFAALRARVGMPTCELCGYDLRGTATDRCPECGAGCDANLSR